MILIMNVSCVCQRKLLLKKRHYKLFILNIIIYICVHKSDGPFHNGAMCST